VRAQIDDGVRRAAARIIAGKGATWFGIGGGMARIAEAIVDDQHAIITCSMLTDDVEGIGIGNVTLSLPRVVARAGVTQTLSPLMTDGEKAALKHSAGILKKAAIEIGF
ncbi:MAG TPA: L-lactate dehydrogenase, partial [Rhodospirillaceae bacterium]|nr:L-lactate dehydrogenase [Rhodospirillaceae bacterium]